MEEKGEIDKVDEVMLPGFRFHPTDEELVGFYLRRKIQQKPLCVELIKQLDIYKFDPWDLPKELALTGEKEWYFYCPRDRKYRNSARPNRVTGAGFWKATGTDRPIYSSEGTKCIGLKKSLVFYRGRAAKGIKTDWMMHEFRLPSVPDSTLNKRPMSKSFAPNDSWAICRIFKKTNSMAQRALSQTWFSSIPENNTCSDMFSQFSHRNQFNSENISCTTEVGSTIEFSCNNELKNPAANYPSMVSNMEIPSNFMGSSLDMSTPEKSNIDIAPMLQNLSTVILGDVCKAPTSIDFVVNNDDNGEDKAFMNKTTNLSIMNSSNWETVKSANFPFNLPFDDWKCSSTWDSPPCPN